MSESGFVYFVQVGDDGPIKIGKSGNIERRMQSLRCANPEPLRLLGTIPGGTTFEHALHRDLAADRIAGEWFKPTRAVKRMIYILLYACERCRGVLDGPAATALRDAGFERQLRAVDGEVERARISVVS